MYSRRYGGEDLNFEASGALYRGSLVMQDQQTDSYWSIMTGSSIGGKLAEEPLRELPVAEKMQWSEWVRRHPDTVVLSIDDVEDVERNPYVRYFASEEGYRGMEAKDDRLATKQPIYSFQVEETPYAVPFEEFEDGAAFELENKTIFLYRPSDVSVFHSTVAYESSEGSFTQADGTWRHDRSGREFDASTGTFSGTDGDGLKRMTGFDTYWYNWSLVHSNSQILKDE